MASVAFSLDAAFGGIVGVANEWGNRCGAYTGGASRGIEGWAALFRAVIVEGDYWVSGIMPRPAVGQPSGLFAVLAKYWQRRIHRCDSLP